MSDEPLRRGAKPLADRDWVFGSRPKRQLLEGVLLGRAPRDSWTRRELAALAGVVANGGVDEHLDGLVRLRLLEPNGARLWRLAQPRPPLATALKKVLVALGPVSAATAQRSTPTTSRRAIATRAVRAAERAIAAAEAELGAESVRELLNALAKVRERLG